MAKQKQTELKIERREKMGKAVKQLRRAGLIPANIYGHKEEPLAVQLSVDDFETLRRTHKTTGILALRLDRTTPQTALVRHVQRHPVTGKIQHIDFFRVSLTERIEVRVTLHYVGEAPGVKIEGGVLLHLLDALSVECAAQDIVDAIEVDVSSLAHIDDTLYARDVQLPDNYKLLADPDEPIAKVAATRAEIEEAAEEEAAAPAEAAAAPAEATSEQAQEE
jgi:large subunit ribosomal protein L25